jgi:hypothetical protein
MGAKAVKADSASQRAEPHRKGRFEMAASVTVMTDTSTRTRHGADRSSRHHDEITPRYRW